MENSVTRGDLIHLETKDFIIINPETVIVDWSNKTKASLTRPYRASRYTVIVGHRTRHIIQWLQEQTDPIPWMSTAEVSALLKEIHPSLSAHSIKVGATRVLEWAVARKRLAMEIKSRILKHENRDGAMEMSLRYGRDPIAQALSLRTQEATLHL